MCITGTDPRVWDTDGGGVPDGEDLLLLGDPLDPTDDSAAPDTDGDRLADLAEIHWHGTDPTLVDSDAGGAPDGAELAARTNPRLAGDDKPLAVDAPLPGRAGLSNTWQLRGASPGANVLLVAGTTPGQTPVPGCPGASVRTSAPRVIGSATADPAGLAAVSQTIPAAAANREVLFHAVERATCSVSAGSSSTIAP